jgi:hypothetical protein
VKGISRYIIRRTVEVPKPFPNQRVVQDSHMASIIQAINLALN